MKNNLKSSRKLSHSQNFLKSSVFVKSLLNKTGIGSHDLVIEIGPGKGVITDLLVSKAHHVIAIEVDKKLFARLREKFKSHDNIEVIKADFLKWNLPSTPYKVFSNIPFNMTADIITKLLNSKNPPKTAYLIIQDKAAERFMGEPVGKDSQMSILLKVCFEMEIVTQINRSQFAPMPRVNIVLAKFKKRQKPLVRAEFKQLFRDFVVYGYNQWKPTIVDAFEKIFSPKQQVSLEKQINIHKAKPRDLTIDEWLRLFEVFVKYVPDEKKYIVRDAEKRLKIQQKKLQKQHRTRR